MENQNAVVSQRIAGEPGRESETEQRQREEMESRLRENVRLRLALLPKIYEEILLQHFGLINPDEKAAAFDTVNYTRELEEALRLLRQPVVN